MSSSEKSGGDWGEASKSLFRAARADHDPTPFDRMRVADALAQRLEGAGTLSTGPSPGVSVVSRGAGSLVTVGNGLKVALGVALTVGTIALMQPDKRFAERAEPKQSEALPQAARDTRSEVQSTGPGMQEVSAASPRKRVEARQAAGSEGPRMRHHALHSSPAPEEGKPNAPHIAQPTGTATLWRDASEKTTNLRSRAEPRASTPEIDRSTRADANGGSAVSGPSPRAANLSSAAADESPARALPAAASATDGGAAAPDPRAEIAWVERIHAAMRARQTSAALALCNEHEKRWPHGVFAVERAGVRAIASCVLRTGEAAAQARAFLEAYPHTPLAPRVVAACGEQEAANARAQARD